MRKPVIAGNWKMHKTIGESVDFALRLNKELAERSADTDVIIAPPFIALRPVAEAISSSVIHLAAQNLHDKTEGAFTGEVSARMLADAGCEYVIVGHSERRILFGEKDDFICRKLRAALSAGLRPIFCIGETSEERDAGKTLAVLGRQLKGGLNNFTAHDMGRVVIAYEPVWAIGTGKTATPEAAQEAHRFVRTAMERAFGKDISSVLPIIYGGSVNPGNIGDLMAEPDIDGALVGGASLDIESFTGIIRF